MATDGTAVTVLIRSKLNGRCLKLAPQSRPAKPPPDTPGSPRPRIRCHRVFFQGAGRVGCDGHHEEPTSEGWRVTPMRSRAWN